MGYCRSISHKSPENGTKQTGITSLVKEVVEQRDLVVGNDISIIKAYMRIWQMATFFSSVSENRREQKLPPVKLLGCQSILIISELIVKRSSALRFVSCP